jgi:hypothetical protein
VTREWIRSLEGSEPEVQCQLLCFLAGRAVEMDADEANGALRRAELLLVAGGDPRRSLDLHGRAVSAVAADLDTPDRRLLLDAGLAGLEADAGGLPRVQEALRLLRSDPDLAWQCYAASLLAEELGDEGSDLRV